MESNTITESRHGIKHYHRVQTWNQTLSQSQQNSPLKTHKAKIWVALGFKTEITLAIKSCFVHILPGNWHIFTQIIRAHQKQAWSYQHLFMWIFRRLWSSDVCDLQTSAVGPVVLRNVQTDVQNNCSIMLITSTGKCLSNWLGHAFWLNLICEDFRLCFRICSAKER